MATSTIKKSTAITKLTTVYTTNQYISNTGFSRLSAYKMENGIYTLYGNLEAANSGATTDLVEIGRINNWNTRDNVFLCVPGQSANSGVMLVRIAYNGIIAIHNAVGFKADAFYRFHLTVF